MLINKKKITCHLVHFAIPVVQGMKIKESEKTEKYIDLAGELKKLWNMKVTVISIMAKILWNGHQRHWK